MGDDTLVDVGANASYAILRHQRSLNRCPDYLNLGAGRITELNIKAYLALVKP